MNKKINLLIKPDQANNHASVLRRVVIEVRGRNFRYGFKNLKLTEMNQGERASYRDKWFKRQLRYQQGSRNWLKCHRRIKRVSGVINV